VSADSHIPLYVDLDGTLTYSDLLLESVFALLRRNPLYVFFLPWWLLSGKANLKEQVAQRVDVDVTNLPYHPVFLEFLKTEHARGRRMILATASSRRYAEQVAQHLGVFAEVLGSDATHNLAGEAKRDVILAHNHGQPFDYAGNERKDVAIWRRARAALVVNASDSVVGAATRVTQVQQIFDRPAGGALRYLHALRPHQWLKNLLLFVPLLTAHQWGNHAAVGHLLLAFLAFGLAASSVYVLNDLLDISADRLHPRKRARPFASGALPLLHGLLLVPAFAGVGVLVAALVSRELVSALLVYLLLTTSYSLYLKRYALIDVLLLAGLYTLRVMAGAIAIDVPLSFWLLAFSVFLFFSIALLKRCTELRALRDGTRASTAGRDYQINDLSDLRAMGMASGYIAVLVFALFINSPEVAERYTHPQLLWLSCPALLYWVSRIWIKQGRGEMHDDPLLFALRDPASWAVLIGLLVVVLASV
jgi:4-hydroxybenzoate polyprenyltransferase